MEIQTEKLFYKDSFIKEFDAKVVSCEPTEQGYQVVLDRTGFFPEGGGQTADTGKLGSIPVFDVQEEGDVIYHMTKEPLEPGTEIKGIINWEERFVKMQHHTGEHIVSGLVHKLFGYNNVGFHLGSQVVTLDFNGVLTKEQVRVVEKKANEAVAEDLPIQVSYPTKEELTTLQYRSKIEILGQVRIITIPGYDVCACCAPHLHRTGQIGMIKIVNMQNYKGGVRLYMLCGFAALADYCEKEDSVRKIALSLSAHESQVAEGVERLKEEIYQQKGEIARLQDELLSYKVAAVKEGSERAVLFEDGLEGNQPRELANKLLEKDVKVAAVFAGNDKNGYRYVIGSRTLDVRSLAKELNQICNGRGGGKPEMVQGSVAAERKQIERFFFR
ncbi:MAG: DHHA1 domain-containing protein [Lachnospiraceae bacterium]|nr:DHHA1 domain-containing protein [Lachnospiraceae bacterium]